MKDTVIVTVIEHECGTNIYVNKTYKSADKKLFEYVKENWYFKDKIPINKEEAIDLYFDSSRTETYSSDNYDVDE